VWTASAEEILEKVRRGRVVLNSIKQQSKTETLH